MKKLFGVLFLFTTVFLQPNISEAGIKFGVAGTKKIADITLSEKAILEEGGKSTDLVRVAAGMREKKVVFIWAKVYVAQIFASAVTGIEKKDPESLSSSLLKNKPMALSLSFLRNVDSKKIVDAFKESLGENSISVKEDPFKSFLDDVQKSAEVKEGQTIWFVLSSSDDQEKISFYGPQNEKFSVSASVDKNLLKNFLSIWFGKAADSGLGKLRDQFLRND